MTGVKFDNFHSFDDWGIVLMNADIPLPEPKFHFVEVPGAANVIDLTEAFGDIDYNQRTITMEFFAPDGNYTLPAKKNIIATAVHGKRLKLVFDNDPEYYYWGRVNFSNMVLDYKHSTITMYFVCDPYKYLLGEGTEPWKWNPFSFETGIIRSYGDLEVDGTLTISIIGGIKAVHPMVSSNAAMTVSLDGGTPQSFGVGVTKLYGITIKAGEHTLTFTGHGKVDIRIQVGTF